MLKRRYIAYGELIAQFKGVNRVELSLVAWSHPPQTEHDIQHPVHLISETRICLSKKMFISLVLILDKYSYDLFC